MSWRAPSLKSNTLLYVQLPENFFFFEDYEIYAPANLIFTSEPKIRIASDLINARTVPLLIKGEVKGKTIRGVYVHRNYKNALMLVIPQPNSCLHVLDGQKLELPSFDNGNLLNIASYSKIDRIELSGPETVPPKLIFGPPPDQDWCFYYEKISLARQQDNWIEAARLADEAAQKGFHPLDGSEWFPIFEAYSNTGQFEKAEQIAPKILENSDARFLYCLQIRNREDFSESFNYDYINSILCSSFP